MSSPSAKNITLVTNDCRYSGTAEELIVNYVHLLILKAKSAESQEENPNWSEAITGVFAENYWKEMKVDIDPLELMGAWYIVY